MMKLLASNTSPLVALSAARRLDLLPRLFDRVQIPSAVFREIVTNGTGWVEAAQTQKAIAESAWVETVAVPDSPRLKSLIAGLGHGEAEAIALAIHSQSPVLLDDLEARKAARGLGVVVLGSLGVVARSKHAGHVVAAKPIVSAMVAAGIYYSDELIERFLVELGEDWDGGKAPIS